jgi:predicted HTH transcriptional regulator
LAIEAVFEHMRGMLETKIDMSDGFRKNLDLFDFDSFREAWVNACVHNDWKSYMPPSVFVFDDRIEVQSYGGIPFKLSMEQFYTGHSMPVNRSLFGIFEALGLTEQSGYGIPKIVERYGREAFDISGGIVKVTIPFAFEPERVKTRKHNRLEESGLSERQKEILRLLRSDDRAKL